MSTRPPVPVARRRPCRSPGVACAGRPASRGRPGGSGEQWRSPMAGGALAHHILSRYPYTLAGEW